jgi:hypothetical protein
LGVLDNDLGKVWQANEPHISVRQLRDWFPQFLTGPARGGCKICGRDGRMPAARVEPKNGLWNAAGLQR